jgi:hypothetical protein
MHFIFSISLDLLILNAAFYLFAKAIAVLRRK